LFTFCNFVESLTFEMSLHFSLLSLTFGDDLWLGFNDPSGPTVRRSFKVFVPFDGILIEEPTASYKALSKLDKS
jgi:hypothetical protein